MIEQIVIGRTKEGKYAVCTRAGKILDGPFETTEEAVFARSVRGFKPQTECGRVTVRESDVPGVEGYLVCIDDIPHVPTRKREDAECLVREFESGNIAYIYKRFTGGLGDLIVMSGAAVVLSQLYGNLTLTSTDKCQHEFPKIFVHHPEIKLEVVLTREGQLLKDDIPDNLLLHNERISFADTHMDQFERVYAHFGIPYRFRWDMCPIWYACHEVKQYPIPDEEYIFVHDDRARKYLIDTKRLPGLPVYHPSDFASESVLAFKDIIENATEVHVIDSSFFHLVECLKPKGNLFWHRYARLWQPRHNDYKLRYKWKILDMELI